MGRQQSEARRLGKTGFDLAPCRRLLSGEKSPFDFCRSVKDRLSISAAQMEPGLPGPRGTQGQTQAPGRPASRDQLCQKLGEGNFARLALLLSFSLPSSLPLPPSVSLPPLLLQFSGSYPALAQSKPRRSRNFFFNTILEKMRLQRNKEAATLSNLGEIPSVWSLIRDKV